MHACALPGEEKGAREQLAFDSSPLTSAAATSSCLFHAPKPPKPSSSTTKTNNKQPKRYRALPRQSRYAQHRLRVLGRAIELLSVARAARTAAQQADLDEMLRGLRL